MDTQQQSKKDKIVVLIGNGLGRAFDNEGFATEHILKNLSSHGSILDIETQRFFDKFFRTGFAKNEDELGKLKELYQAIDLLEEFPFSITFADYFRIRKHLVDEEFRKDFKKHLENLEISFLQSILNSSENLMGKSDFENHMKKIIEFVVSETVEVTIGTLNYDSLLYTTLNRDDQFRKKYTDGFRKNEAPFNKPEETSDSSTVQEFEENFFKWILQDRLAYLHLHGAYFYASSKNEEKISKKKWNEIPGGAEHPLVVLTSQTKKIQEIYSTPQYFLHSYSRLFLEKILDSNHLIIFGYSGRDNYLNADIRYAVSKKLEENSDFKITVICREHGKKDVVVKKWDECFLGRKGFELNGDASVPLQNQSNPCEIRTFSDLSGFDWNYIS